MIIAHDPSAPGPNLALDLVHLLKRPLLVRKTLSNRSKDLSIMNEPKGVSMEVFIKNVLDNRVFLKNPFIERKHDLYTRIN